MSVPLDRLYNFIRDVCDQDVIIYRFLPHGSKKVENLVQNDSSFAGNPFPVLICHDQEPLSWSDHVCELGCDFRKAIDIRNRLKHLLLLHSEKNSRDLENCSYTNDSCLKNKTKSYAFIKL